MPPEVQSPPVIVANAAARQNPSMERQITSSSATRAFLSGTDGMPDVVLGNLYRLGLPGKVIQAILRHAHVSTTASYYIKTATDDVRKAMAKLENQVTVASQRLTDTNGTLTAPRMRSPLRFSSLRSDWDCEI